MNYLKWFEKEWQENKGLIHSNTACKILNVHRSRIGQLIKEKKLKAITHEKELFLSLAEVRAEKLKRITKEEDKKKQEN